MLDLPDELYTGLEQLAKAKKTSVDAQIVTIFEKALPILQDEEQQRQKFLQLLEESRRRREQLPQDIEWPDSTAMIREDRDR
ncbi:MAG: hypothetical protein C4323_02565 [Mastigocladus sp. ERB_26_2]